MFSADGVASRIASCDSRIVDFRNSVVAEKLIRSQQHLNAPREAKSYFAFYDEK